MDQRSARFRHLSLLAGDLGLTGLALYLADRARHYLPIGVPIPWHTVYLTLMVWSLVAIIWTVVFHLWGAYEERHVIDPSEEWKTVFFAVTFSFFAFTSSIYLLKILDFSRLLSFYFYCLDLGFVLSYRTLMRRLFTHLKMAGYGTRRFLVIGAGDTGLSLARHLAQWHDHHIVGFLDDTWGSRSTKLPAPMLGELDEVREVLSRHTIDEVIISPEAAYREDLADLVLALREEQVNIRVVPDLLEMITVRTGIENLQGIPLITLREPGITGLNRVLKRTLDLVGAGIGLVVLFPLMVLVALLIKLDSSGSVLFVQERAGQFGEPFHMYKFRTMVENAELLLDKLVDLEELDEPAFKVRDDPRVTRVGRWLRRTSVDELPQFFNVLKGDMSLVGPRPEEMRLVEKYDAWQSQRLLVKPGITGAMQVGGRADLSLNERVKVELAYIENYSLLGDIKILFQTIPAVASGRGSY